jgi:fission 1 protein
VTLKIGTEIYRAEAGRRRECLYYLALGYYKMGDYTNAKKFNSKFQSESIHDLFQLATTRIDLLIDKEPANLQAQSLNQLIEGAVTRGMFSSFLIAR